MGRPQRLPLLLALLPALLCTLLLYAAHADALSLAYDRNYGAAYVTILQSTADLPIISAQMVLENFSFSFGKIKHVFRIKN